MKKQLQLLIPTAALVIVLLTGCGDGANTAKGSAADDFNLLVITLDTTRADRIGVYGHSSAQTPNLDQLARDGILFENCYSPVPVTLPAHSSIFTGKYPLGHGVRDNGTFYLDKAQVTMAELFDFPHSDVAEPNRTAVILESGVAPGQRVFEWLICSTRSVVVVEVHVNNAFPVHHNEHVAAGAANEDVVPLSDGL